MTTEHARCVEARWLVLGGVFAVSLACGPTPSDAGPDDDGGVHDAGALDDAGSPDDAGVDAPAHFVVVKTAETKIPMVDVAVT